MVDLARLGQLSPAQTAAAVAMIAAVNFRTGLRVESVGVFLNDEVWILTEPVGEDLKGYIRSYHLRLELRRAGFCAENTTSEYGTDIPIKIRVRFFPSRKDFVQSLTRLFLFPDMSL